MNSSPGGLSARTRSPGRKAPSPQSASGTVKKGASRGKARHPLIITYLALYNVLSAAAWAYFGCSFLHHLFSAGFHHVELTFAPTVKTLAYVQTAAVLEIAHVVLGWVPSQLLSTVMQIASRLFVVWLPAYWMELGEVTPLGYSLIAIAWTLSDLTRYIYYVCGLLGRTPYVITWLRYTLFLVLYPMGTLGEMYLISKASVAFAELGVWYRWIMLAILAVYPFGFLFMYTHMLKQRSKHLKRR